MKERKLTPTELLVALFLEKAKAFNANVELIKVLKSRTFKIANANVLIRASSEGNKRYFFGINYIAIEEIANLDNPFIAFICGSIDRVVIIPAKIFFQQLPHISHDRNGEYKINIDADLNIVLSGKGNRLNSQAFINNWELLLSPPLIHESVRNTVEESLHSVIQGRLVEIGNFRGYKTFCPDKSKKFNERKLGDITSLDTCPDLQFSEYELLRQIDVLWFKSRGQKLIPEYAFEVELSTGVWSGVGRMATLMDYENTKLYVIANDSRKYNQVLGSFIEYQDRFRFLSDDLLGKLYSAELNLAELRTDIGL